jgi:hypothetical protein
VSTTKVGSCHCGSIVFSVDLPNGLENLRRCNCSLCKRKGAVMASVVSGALKVLKGADKLTLYQWNTRAAKHYFCAVCGIYTHHQQRRPPDRIGFNVACVEGIDPYALGEIPISNGASLTVADGSPNDGREPNNACMDSLRK